MSPVKRQLRRIPFLRWCAMQHARDVRKKRKDASWAYVQSVLTTIGNMTITWAGIELMLNTLIEWYQARVGTVIRKDLPRDFSRKLAYLKKMEPDIRWSTADREQLRQIRIELARLNEFRKNIVHGLLTRSGNTMDWQAYLARVEGPRLIRRTETYSNEELRAYSKAMAEVSHKMSPFFARLIGLPHRANR
jgi:hypothetical protein